MGGNHSGIIARYRNVLVTMLLGGFWHGAGWPFVIWGGLHGIAIIVEHICSDIKGKIPRILSRPMTFLFVIFAWVPFRAPDLNSALAMYRSLASNAGVAPAVLPDKPVMLLIAAGLCLSLTGPSTREISDMLTKKYSYAVLLGLIFAASLIKQLYAGDVQEFIYFRF
jgi:alginate O-acetyltransferase complex protein AlgI